jgi:hypothetical protein
MTAEERLEQLQQELVHQGTPEMLPNMGRHDGYLFTEVQHVTVVIGDIARNHYQMGGFKVPALRTYPEVGDPTNLQAAARAGEYFSRQLARDERNIELARQRTHGHIGAIIDFEWHCNDCRCPCHHQDNIEDRKIRSLT